MASCLSPFFCRVTLLDTARRTIRLRVKDAVGWLCREGRIYWLALDATASKPLRSWPLLTVLLHPFSHFRSSSITYLLDSPYLITWHLLIQERKWLPANNPKQQTWAVHLRWESPVQTIFKWSERCLNSHHSDTYLPPRASVWWESYW